jgi:cytochrome c-type biogenesis protein CcmH/NrfG
MITSIPFKTWIAGALLAVYSVAGLAVGQEESLRFEVDAAPHIQLIEELEKENSELRLKCEELEAKFKSVSSGVRVLAEREAITKAKLEE